MNMRSAGDIFWSSVGRWVRCQSRIVVECECRFPRRSPLGSKTATVSGVDGSVVTFRDSEGKESAFDFSEALIRGAGFEKIDSDVTVCVFSVFWEDSSVWCTFTELRDTGKSN